MTSSTITGAILSGGPNSLIFGKAKSGLRVGNGSLIDRQVRIMREICSEIIVVTDNPLQLMDNLDPKVRLITDYFTECGPVGGIHAALNLARHPFVWIVGCDMPFISTEVTRRLIQNRAEKYDALIPITQKHLFPLHGLYRKNCADKITRMLESKETTKEQFLERMDWLGIEMDNLINKQGIDDFTYVIQSEDDLKHAQELLDQRLCFGEIQE
ncbi:molybdenum cofactor guanylyltransferase [Cohnella sp. REN36]|uniref:molybdenum cofactor guanylyltransferase n=1 Tax=Cohnella sp. REN36 TaxID=2887347 RepID=UPI001D151D52|nr:molybdenum cofactor guanylyltransferase [Cohnella sp. REN36]MCC3373552.1 molybdenum cofactor guanylyltransferase [Cohnella sp. REN36]